MSSDAPLPSGDGVQHCGFMSGDSGFDHVRDARLHISSELLAATAAIVASLTLRDQELLLVVELVVCD